MRYFFIIIALLFAEVSIAFAAKPVTDSSIILCPKGDSVLWELYSYYIPGRDDVGFAFYKSGKWKFYEIDEVGNRHVYFWYGVNAPSEGVYHISGDTIWLYVSNNNHWQKARGLAIQHSSENQFVAKFVDPDDDGTWSTFYYEYRYLLVDCDTFHIMDFEQWTQTWQTVYEKRPICVEKAFPTYTLKNKRILRLLEDFIEQEKSKAYCDTALLCMELYIAPSPKGYLMVVNSLSTFSGKEVWGVLDGMGVPVFIQKGAFNRKFFRKKLRTTTYSICMEETQYQNGKKVYDVCNAYLTTPPYNSIFFNIR